MSAPVTAVAGQSAAPPRSLSGTLAKTPMPRLLVSASTARVSGTLELACAETGETATLCFVRGLVTKVRTSAPVAYLGSILYELGFIDDGELNESLRELARTKWLHGEILLTRAAISLTQLAEGLHEQTTRKLVHLFSLPASTTYVFDANLDRLGNWGGPDCPHVDPIAAVWRGIRDGFASDDVEAAMAKVQASSFRLAAGASTQKYDLSDVETSAVEVLRVRALTLDELSETAPIDSSRARALVYFLCITKLAEPFDTSGVRPAFRPPATSTLPAAPAVTPHTRPTTREMPAVDPRASESMRASRITPVSAESGRVSRMTPEPTESGRWRAAASVGSYSSTRVPAAVPTAAPTSATRITMGGVTPTDSVRVRAATFASDRPASIPAPPRLPSPQPPALSSGSMRASAPVPERASSSMRAAAPVEHPSGQWIAASLPGPSNALRSELDARKVSIHERARAVLKEDFFQRLSLPRDATADQVDAAFEALRTLWDPGLLPPALIDVSDDCSFVMSCLMEAHETLREATTRDEYTARLGSSALRALVDQHADDLAASGGANALEGANICFLKGELDRAERLCRRALKQIPDSAPALALLAWIEATKPSNASAEATLPRILMLDRAIRADASYERAWYWRGQLHKRCENHPLALRDFRRVVELNPKNADAVREIRVYEMRIRKNSISMKAVR